MKIWIDADAAPGDVRDIVARAALRVEVPAVLVANQRLYTPANNPFVTTERVGGGPDAADESTEENIGHRLSIRDVMDGLRSTGVDTGGPSPFGRREKRAFAASFDRVLTRLLKGG
jgi:uncharacterized protein YaiI (UPF0178 family)